MWRLWWALAGVAVGALVTLALVWLGVIESTHPTIQPRSAVTEWSTPVDMCPSEDSYAIDIRGGAVHVTCTVP